jgi:hypothetical protein
LTSPILGGSVGSAPLEAAGANPAPERRFPWGDEEDPEPISVARTLAVRMRWAAFPAE